MEKEQEKEKVKLKTSKRDRLYTLHGKRIPQGILTIINGKKALATFEGENIIGYTTLEELQEQFYTRKLPNIDLNF